MKEPSAIMQATINVLQNDKNADFQTVKRKVARHGDLFPIVYGRAKALLGLVKVKPRKDRPIDEATGLPKRGPGRPRETPLDAVAASHARRDHAAANNGSPDADSVVGRLKELIIMRNRLNDTIDRVEKAMIG